jgi:hypothetical protein
MTMSGPVATGAASGVLGGGYLMRTGKNGYEILAGLDAVQLATVLAGWATLGAAIFAAVACSRCTSPRT